MIVYGMKFMHLSKGEKQMRINKYIAQSGIASRRKADELIDAGKVIVNGTVVRNKGMQIDETKDKVKVDGRHIKIQEETIYLMLNKPVGCVTTTKDQFDRKSVIDVMTEIKDRVYPIGRLDYDTSGLLFLTNDGDLTYRLTHPKHEVKKTYIALVKGIPTKGELDRFKNGLFIDGKKTAPAEVKILEIRGNKSRLEIKIHEGRNRQVRKMCEAIGHPVSKLRRIAIGKLTLGNLKTGEYRYLNKKEVEYLKNL